MVAGGGLGEDRELPVAPVEAASVDDHAADRGPVAADPLGGGGDHDVGPVVDGPTDVAGAAERVVDDEGDAVVVGQLRKRVEVGHVEAGVADGLDVDGPGARVDRLGEALGGVAVDEPYAEAEAGERDLELVVGAAVEVARGDDVVALAGDGGESQELSGLAARGGERGGPTLESGDPLLEDVGGGVHDARVDVAELLQGEQLRPVLGVVEGVGRGLVDGDGPGVGSGRGLLPGVDLQRLVAGCGRLRRAHRSLLMPPGGSGSGATGGETKNPLRRRRCGSCLRRWPWCLPASLRAPPPARADTCPCTWGRRRRSAGQTLTTR